MHNDTGHLGCVCFFLYSSTSGSHMEGVAFFGEAWPEGKASREVIPRMLEWLVVAVLIGYLRHRSEERVEVDVEGR